MIEGTESFKKRYKVLHRISEGNFGCVFKALDTLTSTPSIIPRLTSRPEKAVHKLAQPETTFDNPPGNPDPETEPTPKRTCL